MGWRKLSRRPVAVILGVSLLLTAAAPAFAANPDPQNSSIGLEATISSTPPTKAATIGLPANGAVFTSVPITVSGFCTSGLLVKIFDNGIFVGSVVCSGGSYSLQIDLFSGRNDLIARVFDSLDQAGPDSNTVSVTFNDAQFLQFGSHVSLTSAFAQRGAPPGTELDWPIIMSGGEGPYAVSVDWGDGSPTDLFSVTSSGPLTLKHTYKTAGVYRVIVKATDKNGGAAFLQLVGQATGVINNTPGSTNNPVVIKQVIWWPVLAMLPLIPAAFWLGKRSEHDAITKRSGANN
jgi:hypothetical protein